MRFSMQDESALALRSAPGSPTRNLAATTNTTQLSVVQEEEDPYFFSEFWYFCSNKFCFGDAKENAVIENGDVVDDRNSITKHRTCESNTRNKNDDTWSCDSTLESSGIYSQESSSPQKFRFFMDPKLAIDSDDASVATLVSADEQSLLLKERWDAVYATNRHQGTQFKSAISLKTEGAKPNTKLWNLKILERTSDCSSFDSRVLGTSIADDSTKPIVLTTSIMDALQPHLPYSKQGEIFWLKYSMVRDGANLNTVLNKTKRSSYTILAVETLDGEVFGAFTAKPWHITWKYYGTPESFLWRLRKRRKSHARDKPLADGDFEVFHFAGNNKNIQLCHIDKIALGGGSPDDASSVSDNLSHVKLTEWGFGLAFAREETFTDSPDRASAAHEKAKTITAIEKGDSPTRGTRPNTGTPSPPKNKTASAAKAKAEKLEANNKPANKKTVTMKKASPVGDESPGRA